MVIRTVHQLTYMLPVCICLPFTDILYAACVFIILYLAHDGYNGRLKYVGAQKLKFVQ